MRQMLVTLLVSLAPAVFAPAQTAPTKTPTPSSLEREFVAGGKVVMRLAAGGYTIQSGPDHTIRVRWQTKKPEQLEGVKVDVQVKGSEARMRVRAPHNSGFEAVIELPGHTDLYVRLSAGDLQIRGIEGNMDVESHAGDIGIHVGSAAEYARVDASARAGDIEAPPFGASKGGLFRSFKWQGKGTYALHVHVGAGSITLLGAK